MKAMLEVVSFCRFVFRKKKYLFISKPTKEMPDHAKKGLPWKHLSILLSFSWEFNLLVIDPWGSQIIKWWVNMQAKKRVACLKTTTFGLLRTLAKKTQQPFNIHFHFSPTFLPRSLRKAINKCRLELLTGHDPSGVCGIHCQFSNTAALNLLLLLHLPVGDQCCNTLTLLH